MKIEEWLHDMDDAEVCLACGCTRKELIGSTANCTGKPTAPTHQLAAIRACHARSVAEGNLDGLPRADPLRAYTEDVGFLLGMLDKAKGGPVYQGCEDCGALHGALHKPDCARLKRRLELESGKDYSKPLSPAPVHYASPALTGIAPCGATLIGAMSIHDEAAVTCPRCREMLEIRREAFEKTGQPSLFIMDEAAELTPDYWDKLKAMQNVTAALPNDAKAFIRSIEDAMVADGAECVVSALGDCTCPIAVLMASGCQCGAIK